MNGYDVEHASQLLVMENLFPAIQHLNGKGVIDTYTKTDAVESVTLIDVKRVLPYAPRFRQVGSANNGTWFNQRNMGGFRNEAQSVHYTIPVDLIYDEGVPVTDVQDYSSPTRLKEIVTNQLINAAALSINIVTFAKQLLGYFRDSYTASSTDAQLAASAFIWDATKTGVETGSATDVFVAANSALNDGVPEMGAFQIPVDRRQAFISSEFDRHLKKQYASNASEAAAQINASGFINPFTQRESIRIDTRTGLCGMYDGVYLFLLNANTRMWVYIAMGYSSTMSQAETIKGILDRISGIICYADATCRGIVGPTVEVNKHPFQNGVYIIPKLKMGVDVINGKGIKVIFKTGLSKSEVNLVRSSLTFTPIDGVTVTGQSEFGTGVYNDGNTYQGDNVWNPTVEAADAEGGEE